MASNKERVRKALSSVKNTVTSTSISTSSTSSEDLSPQQQFKKFASGRFTLKMSEFISDILDDSKNTPHQEMRETWRMRNNDIQVANAIHQKALMVMGRELTVETDDEATKEFFDQEVIPKFRQPFLTGAENAIGSGNGHIEVMRGNGSGAPKDFREMRRPHKIYNIYAEDSMDVVGYLQESFRQGKGEKVSVLISDKNKRTKRGQVFEKDDVIHLKIGNSAMPGYGRSIFMSGLDDYKVSREIKHSQAVNARHKMFPRKAFVFNESEDRGGGIDEPGETSPGKLRRQREEDLSNLDPDENPVYHDVQLDIKDYSYDVPLGEGQEVLEKISKDLTAPVPEFVSNHTDGQRTPSKHPMSLLKMEIATIRESFRSEIDPVFQEIAEARGLDENVSVKFGDFAFPTRDEKTTETVKLFKNNLLTLGQAASRLPFDVEVPEEFEDRYNFELDTSDNPFDQLQQKLDEIDSMDAEEIEDLVEDGS